METPNSKEEKNWKEQFIEENESKNILIHS